MVNAVLRKVAAAQRPGKRMHESVAAFAERLGHPQWMVERWAAQYGRDAALAICEADQREPVESELFTENGPDLPQMDGGSRLVAELAAAAMPAATRVWDCCAAPGGKTLILALREPSADLLATDVSRRRLEQMEARLRRYEYAARVRCVAADAAAMPAGEIFDLILCDVPCSGTGTLARNPEIRHRLAAGDLARQAERQHAILGGVLRQLAPGGRLVYSTCSLEPEENEQVADAVLQSAELRRVPVEGIVDRLRETGVLRGVGLQSEMGSVVRDGALRMLPGMHGGDGFFAVVVERIR